nr:MAG TPA: hypothetical protein [Caudoviricetes sp.]
MLLVFYKRKTQNLFPSPALFRVCSIAVFRV